MGLSDYTKSRLRGAVCDIPAGTEIHTQLDAAFKKIALIAVEDLAAGADIATRIVFAIPSGATIVSAAIIAQGVFAGVDAGNTMVVALKDGAGNTIVTKTYNAVTVPTDSGVSDLGAISATHGLLTANELVTLSITNGATADPPALLLRIEYTPTPPTS